MVGAQCSSSTIPETCSYAGDMFAEVAGNARDLAGGRSIETDRSSVHGTAPAACTPSRRQAPCRLHMPCDMRPGQKFQSHRCRPTSHRSRCLRPRQRCCCLAQTPYWQDPDRTAAAAGCCRQQSSGWSQVRACRKAEYCRMAYLQRCPTLLAMNAAAGHRPAAMHADAC